MFSNFGFVGFATYQFHYGYLSHPRGLDSATAPASPKAPTVGALAPA